jgi:PAS domain-containing protein
VPVSAADFVRQFAKYREEARSSPIYISHHGRKTHVLCEADTFDKLRDAPASIGAFNTTLTLADWIDEALIVCDSQLNVTFINRVARSVVWLNPGNIVGKDLLDALPCLSGTLIEVSARRTLVGRESDSVDIPSPFIENAWLRFQTFSVEGHLFIKFRDITEEVHRHRLADVKEAIIQAMTIHGEIGYVRLSVRGTIDRIDQPLCDMLELPEERLQGILLADLVVKGDKPRFRETLEMVLRDNCTKRMRLELLANSGERLTFTLAMVPLRGAYGAEGAICLLTNADDHSGDCVA